jgi:hypothetical protein
LSTALAALRLAAREQQEEVVAEVDLPDQVARRSCPRTTMCPSSEVQMAERGTVALPIFNAPLQARPVSGTSRKSYCAV